MTEASGNLFTIRAFNVAEGIVNNPSFPQATSLTITGTRPDLSTVSETFPLDGIIDGTGPAIDFQTFTTTVLATEDLISATVSATGPSPLGDGSFSIDNIVVSILEPFITVNPESGEKLLRRP